MNGHAVRLFLRGIILLVSIGSSTVSAANSADNVPLLKDGVESSSYSLEYIREIYRSDITFDTVGRFFIVERSGNYIRVNDEGQVTARVDRPSEQAYRVPFTPFVFVDFNHFYDFSDEDAQLAKFVPGTRFDPIIAEGGFELLYNRAEAVLYGEHRHHVFKSTKLLESEDLITFVKLDGLWSIIKISQDTLDVHYDRERGYDIPAAPQKPAPMILLKDLARNVYSHVDDNIREGRGGFAETNLAYTKSPALKMRSYSSDRVSDSLAYIDIPFELAGHAVYDLSVGTETLTFKEIAKRKILGWRVDPQMGLFVLPESIASEVPVSFLEFIPTTNYVTGGSEGLYVLRPK